MCTSGKKEKYYVMVLMINAQGFAWESVLRYFPVDQNAVAFSFSVRDAKPRDVKANIMIFHFIEDLDTIRLMPLCPLKYAHGVNTLIQPRSEGCCCAVARRIPR